MTKKTSSILMGIAKAVLGKSGTSTKVETATTSRKTAPATSGTAIKLEKVNFGPYEWCVLERKGGTALIITEGIVEMTQYHTEKKSEEKNSPHIGATWENSNLRKFLNGKFYDKFSPAEKERIIEVTNQNPDNPWYKTPGSAISIMKATVRDPKGGNPTKDKIFLLSIEEACRYFGDSTARLRNKGFTQTGSGGGAQIRMDSGVKFDFGYITRISDQNDKNRVAIVLPTVVAPQLKSRVGKPFFWWLRSPGEADILAAAVIPSGAINITGEQIFAESNGELRGVRPVLWLKM